MNDIRTGNGKNPKSGLSASIRVHPWLKFFCPDFFRNLPARTAIACIAALLSVPGIVLAQPTPVSVSPSSGSGMKPLLTFTYSDPAGYQDIGDALVIVTNGQPCYMKYNVQQATLYLVNNDFTQWQPLTPGSAGSVSGDVRFFVGDGGSPRSV